MSLSSCHRLLPQAILIIIKPVRDALHHICRFMQSNGTKSEKQFAERSHDTPQKLRVGVQYSRRPLRVNVAARDERGDGGGGRGGRELGRHRRVRAA